ncbi:MAG: 3-deoxy-manno-octulosonate cytidylyltransferase [Candidatus Omnitrophica bacterium]|nr:3-deoxy-manno-octulosonate cytidylyltransferase [Candidatus Omnitrophota bacterium]MBU0878172.1 3-deoxy-manno-octulosonate cytidylyltransferase [Candidatus Omnitrophota bacterium]MBU0897024.1 3-deoxy-manno-octulosonate cytidylyltransferase [Candidatus Omnitrophota bacterium]MBU1134587.1 3-deoxy-manno-octulosonate cytidylyltransferase [Candidatus Omnitrophota bacterium]MBU1810347.1 3-deoxy-manno-octulosonate cytidylyltransferase [Candidatus Omnitrophota bacterium]
MDVVGVIPARYQSKRLPFKLLRKLKGKPLIQWTWENASKARILDKLIIACDDTKIEEQALGFGAEVVLTSTQHSCGTDRIAEAVKEIETKIIINIQADEPLICASTIDSLAQEMLNNPTLDMATVRVRISDEEDLNNPNTVKVVCDKDGFALYFSRSTIPCYRQKDNASLTYKHLGIYAYTKSFLYTFGNLPFSYLEKAEKLEQLRVLEAGYKIKVIETEFDSPGVDTEEDFCKVERILAEKGCV